MNKQLLSLISFGFAITVFSPLVLAQDHLSETKQDSAKREKIQTLLEEKQSLNFKIKSNQKWIVSQKDIIKTQAARDRGNTDGIKKMQENVQVIIDENKTHDDKIRKIDLEIKKENGNNQADDRTTHSTGSSFGRLFNDLLVGEAD